MSALPSQASTAPDYPRWSETLRDRSHVLIRPIKPQDRDAERAFTAGLTAQSCRFRILGQVGRPSEPAVERLTGIDCEHQATFVAVMTEDAHDRIVGLSRYSTDADGLRCECAVTVDEDWQNKGLGTLLMRHLIEVARARGIRSMYSIDSAENVAMADLALFLGFRTRVDPDDNTRLIHELML